MKKANETISFIESLAGLWEDSKRLQARGIQMDRQQSRAYIATPSKTR